MDLQGPHQVVADPVHRVQGCERVLEDHLHLRGVRPRPAGRRGLSIEQDVAGIGFDDLGQHPGDCRLSGAALAHQGGDLPLIESHGHVVHRVHPGLAGKRAPALLDRERLDELTPLEHWQIHLPTS